MMLRYALQTIRDRKGGFLGAFTALMCAAALITACGTLLETGLRGKIATERYAAAPLIVSADQNVHQTTVKEKKGKTKVKHKAKPVAERAWLPDRLLPAVRAVPGVKSAVPELTFLAQPLVTGGTVQATYGHSWESAPLTPFSLVQGRAPRAATDVVIDQGLASRAHLTPGDRLTVQSTQSPQTYTVTGVAAPSSGQLKRQTSLFFAAAEATRLAARPGQLSAIGVVPEPGVDVGQLKADIGKALAVATGGGRGAAAGDLLAALPGSPPGTPGAPSSSWMRPGPVPSWFPWAVPSAAPRCSSQSWSSSAPSPSPSSSDTVNSPCCAPSPPLPSRCAG